MTLLASSKIEGDIFRLIKEVYVKRWLLPGGVFDFEQGHEVLGMRSEKTLIPNPKPK